MTQRTVQRFVAVAALAGILFLTATPVQARDLGPAPRVLQWVQDLWSRGVSILWEFAAPGSSDLRGNLSKESGGSDPDGKPKPPATTNQGAGSSSYPNG